MTTTPSLPRITGLDISHSTPMAPGTVVRAIYWTVPTAYSERGRFTTEQEAIAAGAADVRKKLDQHAAAYPDEATRLPFPEMFSVDLRWEVDYPNGGGSTFTVTRVQYLDLASADSALDRIRRYAPVEGFVS
jgi:hypothetical protein